MKYILILGGGWQQVESIAAIKKLGRRIIVIDALKNAPGFALADVCIQTDIKSPELIISSCIHYMNEICCIISPTNDAGQITASTLNDILCLNGLSIREAHFSTNKMYLRLYLSKFQSKNYQQPIFTFVNEGNVNSATYSKFGSQIIVKPIDSSGSRGVSIYSKNLIESNPKLLIENFSFSRSKNLILEEHIKGLEYSVEAYIENSICMVIACSIRNMGNSVTAKSIETIPIESDVSQKLTSALEEIIQNLGISCGPIHAEFIIKEDSAYLIDFAIRTGGYWVGDRIVRDRLSANLNMIYVSNLLNLNHKLQINTRPIQKLIFSKLNEQPFSERETMKLCDEFNLPLQFITNNDSHDGSRAKIQYFKDENI